MTTSQAVQAVYVHVPFCRRLCGYCAFYSVIPDDNIIQPLVDALIREIDRSANLQNLAVKTVFVGGGTPTTLPPTQLQRLLKRLRELSIGDSISEFTVEANPATVTPEIAKIMAEAGVNRVSIGAQSFDPADLAVLERSHQPAQVAKTVAICRQAGIARVNLDLIFAIPGQTLKSWRQSLDAALALQSDHLACYGLTFEPGTRLHDQLRQGLIDRPSQDLDADMFELLISTLTDAGYDHYEISNFARPGCRCEHNLCYWHNHPYLGIGPAAAGLIDGIRYKNAEDVVGYTRDVLAGQTPRREEERLTNEQRARETAMLELRLAEGIERAAFQDRYKLDPTVFFESAIGKHTARGLLEVTDRHIRLTRAGLPLADVVIVDFL